MVVAEPICPWLVWAVCGSKRNIAVVTYTERLVVDPRQCDGFGERVDRNPASIA
jgi:hypothetical protein